MTKYSIAFASIFFILTIITNTLSSSNAMTVINEIAKNW